MKRKLLCIILIVVGSVAIAGTIFLSLDRFGYLDASPPWRFEYPDASPAFALIILSIVTIVAAARRLNYEPYSPEAEVSGRERAFLRTFRAVNILSILVCTAFIVIIFFLTKYSSSIHYIFFLVLFAVVGAASAALSLKEPPPIAGRDIAKAAVALVISAALVFVYANYMPKYSLRDGVSILRSDEEYAQKDVMGSYDISPDLPVVIGSNPFYDVYFSYNSDTYGYDAGGLHVMQGYICFNPATGAHEYIRKQKFDKTYGPGDWPEFNRKLMYDESGQHKAVLNLYFREQWPDCGAAEHDPMFFDGSGEWDTKMEDVMYPHNFPEDEAKVFIKSMGEETLKTKILDQINWLDSYAGYHLEKKLKDKPIEVYFFGIDIATYQSGEIALKI